MKIVIDIPDEDYKFIKDLTFYSSGRRSGRTIERNVINGIKNGKTYEERPKGAWVCFQVMNSFSQLESKFKCPFCKREFYSNYDFCVCGADMRVKDELKEANND